MSELSRFYKGITEYKDEIQHFGNRNSGRYRRGSGKHPDSTSGGRTPGEQRKEEESQHRQSVGKKSGIESLPDFIGLPGGGASKTQISQAEKEVGVPFAKDFKNMVEKYGAISVNGHEITGIHPTKPESYLNVVKATKEERQYEPKTALKDAYVIENAGIDGIKVWQKTDGTIHQTSPTSIWPNNIKIANSLEEWVNT